MGSKKLKIEYNDDVAVIRVENDKKTRPEHSEIRIIFPGGEVSLSRSSDKDPTRGYWVHVTVARPGGSMIIPGETKLGRIADARLDVVGRNADTNLGDFCDPNLYHLAVRVAPAGVAPHVTDMRVHAGELTHERWVQAVTSLVSTGVPQDLWFLDDESLEVVRVDTPDTGDFMYPSDDHAALHVADMMRVNRFEATDEEVIHVNRTAYRLRNGIPDDDAVERKNEADVIAAYRKAVPR